MPIYEYYCLDCKAEFEFLVLSEDEVPICPNCNSENAEKRVSASSFSLQGGGWASDGYSSSTVKPKKSGGGGVKYINN